MSKKIFRPLGPRSQFGLKIGWGGGGLLAPSPGSAIVDKGELAFSTITYLFGKSHVSNSLWSLNSGRPTKAFH